MSDDMFSHVRVIAVLVLQVVRVQGADPPARQDLRDEYAAEMYPTSHHTMTYQTAHSNDNKR